MEPGLWGDCPLGGPAPAQAFQLSPRGGGRATRARGTPPGPAAPAKAAPGLLPASCALAPGPRAPRVRGKRGWRLGQRPQEAAPAAPQVPPQEARGGAAAASTGSGGPEALKREAGPSRRSHGPPQASGWLRLSVCPAGLGGSRTFLAGPAGAGRSVGGAEGLCCPRSDATPSTPAARGFEEERARASPWAWGRTRGGGRPRGPGGAGPRARAGAQARAAETRAGPPGQRAAATPVGFGGVGKRPWVIPL